ncbi:hypothetical protein ABC270_05050 [Curtobacterium sp. 1P10AnD]|uniref:hypothetical protein n=1 Tax=Curtobacterium sp. 1P10AnD TaxID=3132283 RepID=UPI0039A36FA6
MTKDMQENSMKKQTPPIVAVAFALIGAAVVVRLVLAGLFIAGDDVVSSPVVKPNQIIFNFAIQICIVFALVVVGVALIRGKPSARYWLIGLSLVGIMGPAPQFLLAPMGMGVVGGGILFSRSSARFFEPSPSAVEQNDLRKLRSLARTGLILSIFPLTDLAGIVLSAVAFIRLGRVNEGRAIALAGIIVALATVLLTVIAVMLIVPEFVHAFQVCSSLGDGVHVVRGVKYTCNT